MPAMFCPQCETEYREGFTTCSDCGVALVSELGVAALVPLTLERSPDLGAAGVEGLEQAEVPYVIEAGTALRVLDGEAEAIDSPEPWQARIWVAPSKADVAVEILNNLRAELKAQTH